MTRRAAVLAMLAACSGSEAVPPGARIGPAIAAALSAADEAREPWRCAAADLPGAADETLSVGGSTWRLSGHRLTLATRRAAATPQAAGSAPRTGARGDGAGVAIGVIADSGGSAPATLAALGRLRGKLAEVDLVLSLGGMGSTAAELGAVFAVLADRAPWPVVALPGDLEAVPAQLESIAAARRRGALVLDGRLVQDIELPGAAIAVVPGAGAASRLVAGPEGCRYRAADVAAALAELTPRPGLRILASAEPPREDGDAPTGELAMAPGAGQGFDVALHGSTRDAASPASRGSRDGSATAVTPGSSDATPRLPGPDRVPSAGILTVRSGTWVWQPIEDAP